MSDQDNLDFQAELQSIAPNGRSAHVTIVSGPDRRELLDFPLTRNGYLNWGDYLRQLKKAGVEHEYIEALRQGVANGMLPIEITRASQAQHLH